MTKRSALALLSATALAACTGEVSGPVVPDRGAPRVTSFHPDVPAWRGGCFFEGAPGKIVNGSPSPDVRLFGHACDGTRGGAGGLVYLDRYDPVAGTGDVTVLGSAPGSRPVVVARSGGSGSVRIGSAGVRFSDDQTRMLAVSDVAFVTGTLQLVDLRTLAVRALDRSATKVRVENFDFLSGDAVLYVNSYDSDARVGDLVYLPAVGGSPLLVAPAISRFDAVMYRLSPDRGRVAYLQTLTPAGGDLHVQTLPPSPSPPPAIAHSVSSMAWTGDGSHLVYLTRNPDGVTSDVWSWGDADGTTTQLATQAIATQITEGGVLVATGWSVLAQQATLHLVAPAGGSADGLGAASVSRSFGAARPQDGGQGLVAYVTVPVSDPSTGTLFLAPLRGAVAGPPTRVEDGVSPAAGYDFSPSAAFVAYARGFEDPVSPGNASPQPGIADALRFASASGTAFDLAAAASFEHVAWDPSPGERYVAAIGAFQPASDSGALVVRRTADGSAVGAGPLATRVSATWFAFTPDGAALVAIRDWDAGLRRGELVVIPTSGPSAWQPVAAGQGGGAGATFFVSRGSRTLYGVRGDGHDGLWLAPSPTP